jgi:uncharacterized protein YggU (UPF0235/DUF167 family)
VFRDNSKSCLFANAGLGMTEFTTDGNTVTFWLKIKPRSSRRRLLRSSSGELCLELTAPPVEGRANEAAVDYLAESLHLPRRSVEIVTGAKSRRKLFRVTSGSAPETIACLEALAQQKGR